MRPTKLVGGICVYTYGFTNLSLQLSQKLLSGLINQNIYTHTCERFILNLSHREHEFQVDEPSGHFHLKLLHPVVGLIKMMHGGWCVLGYSHWKVLWVCAALKAPFSGHFLAPEIHHIKPFFRPRNPTYIV